MSDSLSVEQILQRNGVYFSSVQGKSMFPMLIEGQDTVVIEQKPLKIKKYDVVLVRKKDKLVLHRITKVCKNHFIFVGDNAFYKEKIYYEQIIGILKEFYRGDKLISLRDKKYRRYAFFRVKTYYFRILWHKLKRLFIRRKNDV